MAELMRGFPPATENQVTLVNWRTAPFHRWAFQHVREIVPSADIQNDPDNIWELPDQPIELAGLTIPGSMAAMPFPAFLEHTNTDAMVVLHHGNIAYEIYRNGMAADTPHILMSVSKSLLGLLAGIVLDQGLLKVDSPVTAYVPEVADTAYEGALVRDLLDMRAGIGFNEDYLATSGAIIAYRKATNWAPLEPGEAPSDLRSFFSILRESDGPHGARFHYVSPNCDLLAWVIERATKRRYADLLSDLFWRPLGAQHNGYVTVDRLGAPRAAGGVCVTVRDMARVGQLLVQSGKRGDAQIVPQTWIADLVNNRDAGAWAAGDFTEFFKGAPIRYRSQWYVLEGEAPLLFGLGVHGQNLFIDPANEIVIAKLSSQDLPLDADRNRLTMCAVEEIRRFLVAL